MNPQTASQIVALASANRGMMSFEIPFCLCGPYNSKVRQEVMRLATGQKLPVAKCGVNALETALQTALNVPNGDYPQMTRDNINATLRALAGDV